MKNYEKYKDEIIEARKQNTLYEFMNNHADEINYNELQGRDVLVAYFLTWLMEEYKEPEVDWSKVAVDTPVYVSSSPDTGWKRRHFAFYKNGRVCCYKDGKSSFTNNYIEPFDYTEWEYAILAKENENETQN